MRHFQFSALVLLCVFFLVGCNGSDSSGGPVAIPTATVISNQFVGLYKGSTSYRDAQRGTVTIPVEIRVADDDSVLFTVMSLGDTSTATGSVDANGILTASYPNNSTTHIIGRFYKEGTGFAITGRITSEANGSIPASSSTFGATRE